MRPSTTFFTVSGNNNSHAYLRANIDLLYPDDSILHTEIVNIYIAHESLKYLVVDVIHTRQYH